jgi:hypothetical protein
MTLPPITEQRGGDPSLLFDELLHVVRDAIDNAPRSLQQRIGPSELGTPCARLLGHKLAGTLPADNRDKWLATVGTAVHAWLAEQFVAANAAWRQRTGEDVTRWLVEHRVTVGHIAGEDIDGSTDLYDRVTATVVDWKIVGPTRLKHYRRNGPGRQYRDQLHCYGRGWAAKGHPVDTVMLALLPRNSELKDAIYIAEPYDEQVAVDALARANRVNALVQVLGDEAYTITNAQLIERNLGVLVDRTTLPHELALPLDFDGCRFCPLLNNGCDGDTAATEAKAARAFAGLI